MQHGKDIYGNPYHTHADGTWWRDNTGRDYCDYCRYGHTREKSGQEKLIETVKNQMDKAKAKAQEKKEVASLPAGANLLKEERIGDGERNTHLEHLGEMYSDGHLTREEYEARRDHVLAAQTQSQAKLAVRDLPARKKKEKAVQPVTKPEKKPFMYRGFGIHPVLSVPVLLLESGLLAMNLAEGNNAFAIFLSFLVMFWIAQLAVWITRE